MPAAIYLYVGCYTHESPVGIRVYDSSDPTGLLVERGGLEGIEHPSFLAVHPGGSTLYAVSETTSLGSGGLVACGIDPDDGSLTIIDRAASHGTAPCYASVDAVGRYIYVANYLSGTIAVHGLEPDGRFGELLAVHQHVGSGPSPRQEGPHAHCIRPGPTGDAVYTADLGNDRVGRYVHRRQGDVRGLELVDELALEPGSGPRHIVFHPHEPVAFVVCELDSTIVIVAVDPVDGRLTRRHSASTLPVDVVGDSIAAEVRVHANGRHVYVSNRGHDSIAVFGFAGPDRPLEPLGHVPSGGAAPRNFAVHPSGRSMLVANQNSDTLVPFGIDASTGVPRQLDATYDASQPVCVTFLEVAR